MKHLHLKMRLMALLFALFLCSGTAWAGDYDFSALTPEGQRLYYKITDIDNHYVEVVNPTHNGAAGVWDVTEPSGDLYIPATVTYLNMTYYVKSIGSEAFYDCDNITSVDTGDGVTEVKFDAFYGCSSLHRVTLGPSLITVEAGAWELASHITEVELLSPDLSITGANASNGLFRYSRNSVTNVIIGEGVTHIPTSFCYEFSSLTSISLPNSVTHIRDKAFKGTALESITLPNSLVSIGNNAFQECSGITGDLIIPNSVTTIGTAAFFDCYNISTVTIGNSVASFGNNVFTINGNSHSWPLSAVYYTGTLEQWLAIEFYSTQSNPTWLSHNLYINNEPLTDLIVPEGVTAIKNSAFCRVPLNSISISSTVSSIGQYALYGNVNTPITVFANTPPTCGFNAISNVSTLCPIHVPCGTINQYSSAYCWSNFAYQEITFEITASSYPNAGGSVSGEDTYCYNSQCTLTATPAPGYTFTRWTKDGTQVSTNPNYTFSVTEEASFVAEFTISSYAINVTANPTAGGWVTGAGNYNHGASCTLTATPATGYTFTKWTKNGTQVSTNPSYTFTVSGAASYVAVFTIKSYAISTSSNPTAGGSVSGAGAYNHGASCTLTATPATGYTFTKWTKNGTQVSTNPNYTFTVTEAASYVAVFTINSYAITANANPSVGGTVTGAGNYNHGENVTLSASATADYTFVNWTENDVEVSTSPIYEFTATDDRTLMANFSEISNHWTPESGQYEDNMTITCIVQLDEEEQHNTSLELGAFCGNECRGSQRATYFAPTQRYIFQLLVYGNANDPISFRLYDHIQDMELDLTAPATIPFSINGLGSLVNPYVLNFTSTVPISASVNPSAAGTISGTGDYAIGATATLMASANSGYQFANWTLNGEIVSTSASYQFTVTEAASYVANFNYVHSQILATGWNWWSTYIELSGINGLEMLENSLSNAGLLIKSRLNGYVESYEYNGTTGWYGTLPSINNEQMYKVNVSSICNAIIIGQSTSSSSHPITINNGWNWIGYPCYQAASVDAALANFTPAADDVIKGRNSFTTYYSEGGYNMWYGSLNTLEPGQGYMYKSNSLSSKTLVYAESRTDAEPLANVTPENNVFRPDSQDFADNMTITAVVEMENEELLSDAYEVAAFVNGECRGSVKLMYVEPINRYVAFLTVFGEDGEVIRFRLTDGNSMCESTDEITFTIDGAMGNLSTPAVLHFGSLGLADNSVETMQLFPNPTHDVVNVVCNSMRRITVTNAIGQTVFDAEPADRQSVQINLSGFNSGIYMIRIVTDNGVFNKQVIKDEF